MFAHRPLCPIRAAKHPEGAMTRVSSLDSAHASAPAVHTRKKIPERIRQQVMDRDRRQCRHCGWRSGDPWPVNRRTGRTILRCLEIDHILPVFHGGTNDPSNLQVLCNGCNASKGTRI